MLGGSGWSLYSPPKEKGLENWEILFTCLKCFFFHCRDLHRACNSSVAQFCTEFHPDRLRNMECASSNSFGKPFSTVVELLFGKCGRFRGGTAALEEISFSDCLIVIESFDIFSTM